MKNFKDNLNIIKLKPGSWRSMLGYAGQEIALTAEGKARTASR